jgi:hypothetical protein
MIGSLMEEKRQSTDDGLQNDDAREDEQRRFRVLNNGQLPVKYLREKYQQRDNAEQIA